MIHPDDPLVTSEIHRLCDDAKTAGYEHAVYGALVIAVTALVRYREEEAPKARHPRGGG